MKKLFFICLLFLIQLSQLFSSEPKLQELFNGLDSPWSLSFINDNKVLVTEKSGNILSIDFNKQKINKIKHNLKILEDGQGGLLEVLYYNGQVFVSYSEDLKKGNSSTSVASAKFNEKVLEFKNIFRSEPPINSGYHFGSRLVIKDNLLYVTAGERGKGMIAQDPTKHPGSIIRVNLDGSIPKNNPNTIIIMEEDYYVDNNYGELEIIQNNFELSNVVNLFTLPGPVPVWFVGVTTT